MLFLQISGLHSAVGYVRVCNTLAPKMEMGKIEVVT